MSDPRSSNPNLKAPGAGTQGSTYRLPAQFGRYTLIRRLGAGGMAEAFLAEQEGPAGFSKTCVVKRILPHLADEQRFVEMFQREAQVSARLAHTNLVQVYELGEVDGVLFIAMEHVDGPTLLKLSRAAWGGGLALPIELVCCAIGDAALGLHAAHELREPTGEFLNLIHRDVTPDNLIINREGVTKVLDFGIARTSMTERTATGELKGKVPYLAPEQVQGETLDRRADLYSLGVSLYWLLTGERPLRAPNEMALMHRIVTEVPAPPNSINPAIPEPLNDLTMRLLEKRRERRPATGAEVHDALASAMACRRSVVAPFVEHIVARFAQAPLGSDPDINTLSGGVPAELKTANLRFGWLQSTSSALLLEGDTVPQRAYTGESRQSNANVTAVTRVSDTVIEANPLPPDVTSSPKRSLGAIAAMAAVLVASAAAGIWAISASEDQAPRSRSDVATAASHAEILDGGSGVHAASPSPSSSSPSPSEGNPARGEPPTQASGTADPLPGQPPTAVEDAGALVEVEPPEEHARQAVRRTTPKARPKGAESAGRSIEVKGSSAILWLDEEGKVLGIGTTKLQLSPGVRRIIATDQRTGGRTTITPGKDAVDYSALPRGTLEVKTDVPAEISLGAKSLGKTPMAPIDLVAATYQVRVRKQGRVETRTVEVKPGQAARIAVSLSE